MLVTVIFSETGIPATLVGLPYPGVTVYAVLAWLASGVPVISQFPLNESPAGNAGLLEHDVTDPPLTVGEIVPTEVPSVKLREPL
jgi:hypothetical protein